MIKDWIEKLKNYWLKNDYLNITNLFSVDCKIYDSPFDEPIDAKAAWSEIGEQNIKNINHKILMCAKNECVVEFEIVYEDEICSAVNYIVFNEDFKCSVLKQWYMCKNN